MRTLCYMAAGLLVVCDAACGQTIAAEDKCAALPGSGDGVPAEYHQEQCFAELAMSHQDWPRAERHLRSALAVPLLDAPNYDLQIELGEVTCHQGRIAEGKALLSEFICLANADLGNIRCETRDNEPPKDACQDLACNGTGSVLSADGEKRVKARLAVAVAALEKCDGA